MLPLKNKTVLVTRSKEQASDFIMMLENIGATTIALPLISTAAINQIQLSESIEGNKFTWIIFTSPNAVKFFFETISPQQINCKIAVVGSKTEEHLEALGIKIDLIPSQFTAKQLASEIPVKQNENIFIPRSNLAKNTAVEILEKRNCSVETLAIYENTSINYSKEELETIFKKEIDFITFTSGSTVSSFMKLGIELNNEKVICIGPETAKVATQNNINIAAIAKPHTIEGIIASIKKSLTN